MANDILSTLTSNPLIIIIVIAVCILIYFLLKNKKPQREYYSEIDRHKEIINKELAFNKSDYRFLVLKTALGEKKYIGKIVGYKTDNIRVKALELDKNEVKNKKLLEMKALINSVLGVHEDGTQKEVEDFKILTMSVNTKMFSIPFTKYKIGYGTPDIFTTEQDFIKLNSINMEVECDSDIGFEYRDGRYISTKSGVCKFFTEQEIWRTVHDHSVNAMGYQAHRLSEIKDEYAHLLNMKDKDAEIEERKRKVMMENS